MNRLDHYIQKENLQLESRTSTLSGVGGYSTDRDWLKYLFWDIERYSNPQSRVLEVGCGDGMSLIDICRNSKIQANNCFGTSLQPLPTQLTMRNYGINLRTGIIAEDLPHDWTDSFAVTMACAVLMHVDNVPLATSELFRVTESDGHILIYDLRHIVATVEAIAISRGYQIFEPRVAVIKNLFGSIIQKS